jgi:hypothetical protein
VETRRPLTAASRWTNRACPFCGRAADHAVMVELRSFQGFTSQTLHQVGCPCGANGPARPSASEAAEAWGVSQAHESVPPRLAAKPLPRYAA